ncbi:hypothetical protein LOZ52_003979 [Ophidiomyces ophidiicola]|uniref:uncharacterized protein n=1 Tax=Ophidiomyces ophidiicola TaxID=1387563 RepID=UPI0020C430A8|nr:uncharacterized protein LOZ57_003901 [Ophidiomyces ophidiicola]KAI1946149.1 hypothetical protein LOZ57_003901 [Ophidiomyces ophidiicola]KAI1961243.1 hypothetical protein LOZ59_002492 [Ophidiomyces ophidiicola]KAI2023401.1 hypothetical protein LOZ45_003968 [Ophidiomyces ophidiicola]KAI2058218.1 hypothetical protein LOZ43_002685 [Ophidiomyces ophidiicola]KAI2067673.1 hypothetical protein LOZ40_002988 [Ophidiomyces ophidiicola]
MEKSRPRLGPEEWQKARTNGIPVLKFTGLIIISKLGPYTQNEEDPSFEKVLVCKVSREERMRLSKTAKSAIGYTWYDGKLMASYIIGEPGSASEESEIPSIIEWGKSPFAL